MPTHGARETDASRAWPAPLGVQARDQFCQRDFSGCGVHAGQDARPMLSPPLNWAIMRGRESRLLS
jgi:hypothetical protein